jgi:hypothetical protein
MPINTKLGHTAAVIAGAVILLLFTLPGAYAQQSPSNPSLEASQAYLQVWNEIQALKQSGSEIPSDLYSRYFALEAEINPPDNRRGRDGSQIDQGLDGCPGYLVTQPVNGDLTFDDWGQTDNAHNDCTYPLCRVGKDVVFAVDINHPAWLQITTCGSRFDTYLCIFKDSCGVAGHRVFYNDDSPLCGPNSIYAGIDTCFSEPGRYFVVVDGYGVGAWGHYGLHIRTDTTRTCFEPHVDPTCPPTFLTHTETNDEAVCEYGKSTDCPAGWCGMIDPRGDLDVYQFNVTSCSVVTLSVFANDTPNRTGSGNGLNPTLRLFEGGACDHPLYTNSDVGTQFADITGRDSRIVTTGCLRPGTYWAEVSGDTTVGPYEFTIACTPCPVIPPVEGVTFQNTGGRNFCVNWTSQLGATVYYVWRALPGESPVLVGTTSTLQYCETVPGEATPFYMVYSTPCMTPTPAR